jgi:hypothetical protein
MSSAVLSKKNYHRKENYSSTKLMKNKSQPEFHKKEIDQDNEKKDSGQNGISFHL